MFHLTSAEISWNGYLHEMGFHLYNCFVLVALIKWASLSVSSFFNHQNCHMAKKQFELTEEVPLVSTLQIITLKGSFSQGFI